MLVNLVRMGSLNIKQEADFRADLIGTLTFLSYSGVLQIESISYLDVNGSSNLEDHMDILATMDVLGMVDRHRDTNQHRLNIF